MAGGVNERGGREGAVLLHRQGITQLPEERDLDAATCIVEPQGGS